MRDAEAAKGDAASPSSSSRSRRCRGARSPTVSSPTSCTQLGVDIDDVDLADFRARHRAAPRRRIATDRSDPGAQAATRRYLVGLLALLTFVVAALVATAVAVFTAARGHARLRVAAPAVARCRCAGRARRSRSRCVTPAAFVAVMVVATAGALTWGFVGDTHGDAAWIVVLALRGRHRAARSCSSSRRWRAAGAVFEHALDDALFGGRTPGRRARPGHAPRVLRHRAAVGAPVLPGAGDRHRVERGRGHARASCGSPPRCGRRPRSRSAFPPVELHLDRLGVQPGAAVATAGRRHRCRSASSCSPTAASTTTWPTSGSTAIPSGPRAAPCSRRPRRRTSWSSATPGRTSAGRRSAAPGSCGASCAALKRDVDVTYDVSTSQRRRTLLRLFREAERGRRRAGRGHRAHADVAARRVRRVHRRSRPRCRAPRSADRAQQHARALGRPRGAQRQRGHDAERDLGRDDRRPRAAGRGVGHRVVLRRARPRPRAATDARRDPRLGRGSRRG